MHFGIINKMAPLYIKIMLHYYCSVGPYFTDKEETLEANKLTKFDPIQELLDEGLLTRDPTDNIDRDYWLTERGLAYVNALCAMPVPVKLNLWKVPEQTIDLG